MKILLCHNYYQQRGGEDQLFEDDAMLLESNGHQVVRHTVDNDSIRGSSLARTALNTIWNAESARQLGDLISRESPDVLHAVNTFPLLSPAIFHTARSAGVPVVVTIQNYRYFCAQAMCFRNGSACELCLGKLPWRAVWHGCYRGSRSGSAVVALMQLVHRMLGTWSRCVDVLCVASEFSRGKLAAAGLPKEKMLIKPNFVTSDPGPGTGDGQFAVFVGRLAGEKGIETLVEAWRSLNRSDLSLKIIGDGPEETLVEQLAKENASVEWLGRLPNDQVYDWLGRAACLIFSSTGYESLPKTLIESMAVGTPVIGSRIGSIPEIVLENQTGVTYQAGDSKSLANSVGSFFARKDEWPEFRRRCRREFEARFTKEANYRMLIDLYEEAIRRRAFGFNPASA